MKLAGSVDTGNLHGTALGTTVGMEGVGVVTRTGAQPRFQVGDVVLVAVPGMFRRHLTVESPRRRVERLNSRCRPRAGRIVPYRARRPHGAVHAARLGADGPGPRRRRRHWPRGDSGGAEPGARDRQRHPSGSLAHAASAPNYCTVDSRSANFVDDVMRLTDGRGADVIYTSLPGEALRQNLKAAGGIRAHRRHRQSGHLQQRASSSWGRSTATRSTFAVDMDRMFTIGASWPTGSPRRSWRASRTTARTAALPATTYDADQLPEALGLFPGAPSKGAWSSRWAATLRCGPPCHRFIAGRRHLSGHRRFRRGRPFAHRLAGGPRRATFDRRQQKRCEQRTGPTPPACMARGRCRGPRRGRRRQRRLRRCRLDRRSRRSDACAARGLPHRRGGGRQRHQQHHHRIAAARNCRRSDGA